MKRVTSIFLVLAMVLALLPVTVLAADNISVTVNGQAVVFADQGPVIVNGRTLVPVAGVFQALGFETQWNREAQQVTITRGTDTVVVTIGSNVFTTNYMPHTLDVPAQIIRSRTMLPIAAVLRSVGYEVNWDGTTRTVAITPLAQAAAILPVPATPLVNPLVDTWNWIGTPFYAFEADGTGIAAGIAITWWTNNGMLYVCVTPEDCQDECPAPSKWYYIIEEDRLTLTSRIYPDVAFIYTRYGTEIYLDELGEAIVEYLIQELHSLLGTE